MYKSIQFTLLRAAVAVLKLLLFIKINNTVSDEIMGNFVLGLSTIVILSNLVRFGGDTYFFKRLVTSRGGEITKNLFISELYLNSLFLGLVSCLFLLFGQYYASGLSPWVVFLSILALNLNHYFSIYLRALGQDQLSIFVYEFAPLFIAICGFLIVKVDDADGILLLYFTSNFCIVPYVVARLRMKPFKFKFIYDRTIIGDRSKIGVSNLSIALFAWGDVMLATLFLSPTVAASFFLLGRFYNGFERLFSVPIYRLHRASLALPSNIRFWHAEGFMKTVVSVHALIIGSVFLVYLCNLYFDFIEGFESGFTIFLFICLMFFTGTLFNMLDGFLSLHTSANIVTVTNLAIFAAKYLCLSYFGSDVIGIVQFTLVSICMVVLFKVLGLLYFYFNRQVS